MKTIVVCGSREFADVELVRATLRDLVDATDIVIHGAARGADLIAARVAVEQGAKVVAVPADWARYGRSAGFRRNEEMIAMKPDLVIAFYAGKRTPGTAHTVGLARTRGIEVMEVGL